MHVYKCNGTKIYIFILINFKKDECRSEPMEIDLQEAIKAHSDFLQLHFATFAIT